MFTKEDLESLASVFSLARAKIVETNISNKEALIKILSFEEGLKQKMIKVDPPKKPVTKKTK